ncbi:hypothetical protein SPAN111604_08805 [Sphingomonas antarctica]|uniref:sensor histidine kinase n=1 Tax=Sphingomonas antarctica TaxID=2040274 RepID=UPI0039EB3389
MAGVQSTVEDARRLHALEQYELLDTPGEAVFDDIVAAATALCATPIGLVSLVDDRRQWFKARAGIDFDSTPVDQAVCAHAITARETFIIPDLTRDPRTAANPLVTGEGGIRFYAGVPLIDVAGHALGTLCVIDIVARPEGLNTAQRRGLEALGRSVMAMIELRRHARIRDDAVAVERRLGDLINEQNARTQSAQEAGRIGTFDFDLGSDIVRVSPEFCRIYGVRVADEHDRAALEKLLVAEDRAAIAAARRKPAPGPQDTLYRIVRPDTGALRWIERRGTYEFDAAGRATTFIGTIEDVTERVEAEQQQRLVNQEIGHRLKNALSVAQAIATQTLRRVADPAVVEVLEQRLYALGAAHDILMRGNWHDAPIDQIIESVINAAAQDGRIVPAGPPVVTGSKAALSMSLLLHELTTNAIKYGALSVPEGRVDVTWRIEGEDDAAVLMLDWIEHGGPPAQSPTTKGFGSRLINLGLAGTGGTTLRYSDTGLSAHFRTPMKIIVRQ